MLPLENKTEDNQHKSDIISMPKEFLTSNRDSSIFIDLSKQEEEKALNNNGADILRVKKEKTAIEDFEQTEKIAEDTKEPLEKKKKPLRHYICCICCPCLPMWSRYGCCTLLLLFIIFLIIVGTLAALFKIPEVNFNGPARHPYGMALFEKLNDSLAFSVNLGLKIGVINSNVESITFESIKAIAYYPTAPKVPVGGGEMYNLKIKSYGITNFTFPFSIKYDPNKDEGFTMLMDLAKKCALFGGGDRQDLTIEYDLRPTVRIAGIAMSPVIRQSSSFPCPLNAGEFNIKF